MSRLCYLVSSSLVSFQTSATEGALKLGPSPSIAVAPACASPPGFCESMLVPKPISDTSKSSPLRTSHYLTRYEGLVRSCAWTVTMTRILQVAISHGQETACDRTRPPRDKYDLRAMPTKVGTTDQQNKGGLCLFLTRRAPVT